MMFQPYTYYKLPLCISLIYFKEIVVYNFILSKEWGRGCFGLQKPTPSKSILSNNSPIYQYV